MWTIIRRAIVPVLLLLGSIGSVIYGARFHTVQVMEEEEREISIAPPPGVFPPGMPFGDTGFGGSPPGMPPGMPPPPAFTTTVIETTSVPTSEPTLIWEVTFGGVARLELGELKRTYSGKAPSLCPT